MSDVVWIWIFRSDTKKFARIRYDDPRLDWSYPHAPANLVRFSPRKNSKNWFYCPFGSTAQVAADRENAWVLGKILDLETQLAELKARLVVPPC